MNALMQLWTILKKLRKIFQRGEKMSFIDEHPDYQSYVSFKDYHFHDVPSTVWTPLESLVEEAGGDEGENLVRVVSLLARKIRFGHIDPSFACQAVPDIISSIRKKVKVRPIYGLLSNTLR